MLNINDELKITCCKYSRETKCYSHFVSIIKNTDACDCVIQSVAIQLIGSHYNCISNDNFIIYHTFKVLSLNGYITRTLCHTIGKMSISYIYLAQPAYLTSVLLKQNLQVCLLKTKFQLYPYNNCTILLAT